MKRKQIIVTTTVAGLAFAGGGYAWRKKHALPSVKYKQVSVVRQDLGLHVLSTGTVAPQNKLNIQAPVAGRAEQVLVDQGSRVRKGQILAWVSSTERASILDGARSEGPESIKKWEDIFKPTSVIAPVSGMVIQRNIQPGQTFTTTDAIFVMSDHLIVQAQVDETDLAQIALKQAAVITLDAYPNQPLEGEVRLISFDAKTVNNVTTYEVDIAPKQVPQFMRSGMTANVNFVAEVKTGVLTIPASAVKSKDGTPYVLLPAPDAGKEPLHQEITLGLSEGGKVEILSGLSEGQVVLEQEFELKSPGDPGTNPFMPRMKKH